jgi:type IV pilus assembly protein PilW
MDQMDQNGFTLIELLVGVVLASIVGLAAFVIFWSSDKSYKLQEGVGESQQNVRVAMDRLARDIRMAGFGLPDPPFSLTIGGQTLTAPIAFTNSAAAPDTLTVLGIGVTSGTLNQGGNAACNGTSDTAICLDTVANFFTGAAFLPDRRYITVGGPRFIELALAGHDQTNGLLQLGAGNILDRDYVDGTTVYIIQAIQYSINTALAGCSVTNPCLTSNDLTGFRGAGVQVLADNIEDVQFAYGLDGDRNGRIDDSDGNGAYTSSDFSNAPLDLSSIIAIRANVVARTRNTDPTGQIAFRNPCLEDRSTDAACTGAANDGFRRRTLTKVINLRNPRQGA